MFDLVTRALAKEMTRKGVIGAVFAIATIAMTEVAVLADPDKPICSKCKSNTDCTSGHCEDGLCVTCEGGRNFFVRRPNGEIRCCGKRRGKFVNCRVLNPATYCASR